MDLKKVAVGLAGVGIVGAIALGNSVAFADDSTSGNQPALSSTSAPMGQNMGHRDSIELDAAAKFLGLSNDELFSQLQAGKTLAEVAEAQGKSVQGLIDALVVEATTKITEMVNNPLPPKPFGHGPKGMHQDEYGMDADDDDINYESEDYSEIDVTP